MNKKISIRSEVIKRETIKDDLFKLLSFDADDNGDNGDEYLKPEPAEAGYTNNLSYYIDQACAAYTDVDDIIEFVLKEYDQSYWDCDFDVINIDDITSYCSIALLS